MTKYKIKMFINTLNHIVDTTPRLVSCKADIKTLCEMLSDWAKGSYKHISKRTGVIVGICIAYILSPIDIIPDFIPIFGQIDDVAVVMFMLRTVKRELGFYRIWKAVGNENVIDV